ncbi:hypothetical protein HDU78_011011, partial [Chytriomyces hyalinus]
MHDPDSNYPVWKCLMLAVIRKGNTRTLSLEFTPFFNSYIRPGPPVSWVQVLDVEEEFQEAEDDNASNKVNSESGPKSTSMETPA